MFGSGRAWGRVYLRTKLQIFLDGRRRAGPVAPPHPPTGILNLHSGAGSWHKPSTAPLLLDGALRARAQSFTRVAMSAPAAAPASAMASISPYGGLCGEAAAGEAAAVATAGAGAELASTGLPPT